MKGVTVFVMCSCSNKMGNAGGKPVHLGAKSAEKDALDEFLHNQVSWGDFPFDKPLVVVLPTMDHNKKNKKNTRAECVKTSEADLWYPLL